MAGYEAETLELTFNEEVAIMAGLRLLEDEVATGRVANDFLSEPMTELIHSVRVKIMPVRWALGLDVG